MTTRDGWIDILQARKVVNIDLANIDRNLVQPPSRVDKGVRELAGDIERTHFVEPVVLVKKHQRYTAIDGHRRMAAVKLLGGTTVPAIVLAQHRESTEKLFLLLNRSAQKVDSAQLYWAWGADRPEKRAEFLALMPPKTRNNIVKMIEIFGLAEAVQYATADKANKISPHIGNYVEDAKLMLVSKSLEPPPLRTIGRWVIKHKQTNAINKLKRDQGRDKVKVRRLLDAILADRPLHARKASIPKTATKTRKPASSGVVAEAVLA